MKFNNRIISLVLIIVLAIGILSACTPKISEPVDNEVLFQNAGFISEKITKDDKNYIEIRTDGGSSNLEVIDKKIFENIEDEEFYIYTYNSDNVLRSLSKNETIKSSIIDSSLEDAEPITNTISPVAKIDVEDLTILDEYEVDFDNDNTMEKVNMYTTAGRAENGEIMWDDGQRWLIVVHGEDKDYVLFDDYVQLGQITTYIYTIDQNFFIDTLSSGTANLTLKSYLYSQKDDTFIETIPFDTEGNVNMMHSSAGL